MPPLEIVERYGPFRRQLRGSRQSIHVATSSIDDVCWRCPWPAGDCPSNKTDRVREIAEQPRNRFNTTSHIDLCKLLTNFGSPRFTGRLNLAANILGKPGKMDIQGNMVQDMYEAGRLAEINDYCRYDALDTYFVFLRTRVLQGQLALEAEQQLIAQAKQWIESKADSSAGLPALSGSLGATG